MKQGKGREEKERKKKSNATEWPQVCRNVEVLEFRRVRESVHVCERDA